MRLITRKALKQFWETHKGAKEALLGWEKIMRKGSFKNLSALRKTFNSVDLVRRLYVFNIKGNHYRLIASINWETQIVYIRKVLTHKEYDKGTWKER